MANGHHLPVFSCGFTEKGGRDARSGVQLKSGVPLSDGFFSVDPFENPPPPILPLIHSRTESSSVLTTLQRILNRLGRMELPGADQLEAFLRHVARRNRRPRTLCSLWQSNMLFLCMLRDAGRCELGSITRADVETFIEREQDRGIRSRRSGRGWFASAPSCGTWPRRRSSRRSSSSEDPPAASRAAAPGHGSRGSCKAALASLTTRRTGR